MDRDIYYNKSGYYDPTAGAAITKVDKEAKNDNPKHTEAQEKSPVSIPGGNRSLGLVESLAGLR